MIKNKNRKMSKIIPLIIFISTILMSIGYASINSISLDFSGEVIAKEVDGIYITEVNYVSDVDADLDKSKILNAYQTNLNSNIILSDSNKDSSITYEITIKNTFDYDYIFNGVEYLSENYSNSNIIYSLSGINEGDILKTGDIIIFKITFHYKDYVLDSNNILESLINFDFSIKPYVVAEYVYTGDYETFVVPNEGVYKIELWGAQGGGEYGGNGGYVSGEIVLNKSDELYVYIGEHQERGDFDIVFNGGGSSMAETSVEGHYNRYTVGGGSTDIRLVAGEWDDFYSLKSRIMVAGAGGGGYYGGGSQSVLYGGAGGGLVGKDGIISSVSDTFTLTVAYGGSQTSGGAGGISSYNGSGSFDGNGKSGGFGYGGSSVTMFKSAGGSGYYGGGSSGVTRPRAGTGAGGSSFISGHNGCDAITETSTEDNIVHTGQSIHYSGYKFTDTIMIDGEGYNWTTSKGEKTGMPSYDNESILYGNVGHGYAKITFISDIEE